jgi:hypothetical protein
MKYSTIILLLIGAKAIKLEDVLSTTEAVRAINEEENNL